MTRVFYLNFALCMLKGLGRVSMGAENFFCSPGFTFQFVGKALFAVLTGVSGAVCSCFIGTSNVAKRDV